MDKDHTESLKRERGEPDVLAGPEEQQAELPIGPLREAIVDLHPPAEDETVQADRREAERRGDAGS